MPASDTVRDYVREHPFTTTLGLWGGILAGTGLYLYKRQIPLQLKIIQARILAQAGLIVGAVSLGVVGWVSSAGPDEPKVPATSSWKLRDYSRPVAADGVRSAALREPLDVPPAPAAVAELK